MGKEFPSRIRAAIEAGAINQYAALCFRTDGNQTRILLITSRGTKRWILPKGWPISGLSSAETAAREAWEEAGVQGKLLDRNLGFYTYEKQMNSGKTKPCVAMVFPIAVKRLATQFPERGQRQRKWFSPKKAATRVQEPELARMLRNFDPAKLR